MQIPDLVLALDTGLREAAKKDTWGPEKVHMSDLAVILDGPDQKPPRQVWHRLRGDPRREDSVGTLFMFDHGHRIHERVTELIREPLLNQGWEIVGVEKSVNDLLPEWMSGTLDLELKGPNGEKVIVDYKTIRGNSFKYLNKPKESNVIQIQGYMMVTDADFGILLYLDREGQNTPVMFIVERDDERVKAGMALLEQIKDSPEPPARLKPKVVLSKNKGPDGVRLELPWQDKYCPYLDTVNPGALRPELRDKIVGYLDDDDNLVMKEEYEDLYHHVRFLIQEQLGRCLDPE